MKILSLTIPALLVSVSLGAIGEGNFNLDDLGKASKNLNKLKQNNEDQRKIKENPTADVEAAINELKRFREDDEADVDLEAAINELKNFRQDDEEGNPADIKVAEENLKFDDLNQALENLNKLEEKNEKLEESNEPGLEAASNENWNFEEGDIAKLLKNLYKYETPKEKKSIKGPNNPKIKDQNARKAPSKRSSSADANKSQVPLKKSSNPPMNKTSQTEGWTAAQPRSIKGNLEISKREPVKPKTVAVKANGKKSSRKSSSKKSNHKQEVR